MERKETIQYLSKKIREELSIKEVIGTRISIGKPLCPFHNDKTPGSFQISEGKGIWKCFSCGESGDAIGFVQKFDGISREDAILKISAEFGMITPSEYELLSQKTFFGKTYKFVSKGVSTAEAELQDPETLDLVYRLFMKGNEYLGGKTLSDEHREYLNNRGIFEEEIEKYHYFTIPQKKIMRSFQRKLASYGLNSEDLIGVPGFYRSVKSNWITFTQTQGIGIPIVNEKGLIQGIQIRKDKVKGKASRYVWFSSSFTSNPENTGIKADGCGPGSPLDVIIPEEIQRDGLIITEGHFKAVKFCDKYGTCGISVQGVGNFEGIDKVLKNLIAKHSNLKNVIIAYDADMAHNDGVKKHLYGLVDLIKKETSLKIFVARWDEKYGKGIDDVLENENQKEIRYLTYTDFLHEELLNNTD